MNQLSIAAAAASLADPGHVAWVREQVAVERTRWLDQLRRLGLRYAEPAGNFVFFDVGRPQAEIVAALKARKILVARAFPPYDTWVRISIGTPAENRLAQAALERVVHAAG